MMEGHIFAQELVNAMVEIFVSPFKAVAEITLEYILREGFSALIMYPIAIYFYYMLFKITAKFARRAVTMIKARFRRMVRRARRRQDRKREEAKIRREQFKSETKSWYETDPEFEELYQKYCG